MSDPVSNGDVDGVLLSIRRLVSDKPGHAQRPDPADADRFVLTDALRVADAPPAPAATSDHDEAADETIMPAEAGDTPSDSTPVLLTGPRFADASIERAGIGALVSREVSRALDPGAPETPEIAPLPGERDVAHDAEAADRESDTPLGEGIDEDRLRDLVAELVRQELQGVLGERITRNVRKLVRREIHRVLLSHEAE